MKRFTVLTVLVLIVGLVAGAASATASSKTPIFEPPQVALSATGAVNSANAFAAKLNRKKSASKNYLSYASKRNSKIVGNLNALRKKRNQARSAYLSDQITNFENKVLAPINRRYNEGLARAKRTYNTTIRRINRGKGSEAKKRAARAKALSTLQAREASLAQTKTEEITRANARINATRQANLNLYKRISLREKTEITRVKRNLRDALAGLRKRS